jgi:hypothetical protein
MKLTAIKTLDTKGKSKSASASGEYPLAAALFSNSTEAPVGKRYLLATNFMVEGLGVISL